MTETEQSLSDELTPVWVEKAFPPKSDRDRNILYISRYFGTCSHPCRGGCGVDAYIGWGDKFDFLPDNERWTLVEDEDGKITIGGSLLCRICKAHYFIRKNRIEWCK